MRKQRKHGIGEIAIVAVTLCLTAPISSCDLWGGRTNPVDPASKNYQGYTAVSDSADIYLVSPASSSSLTTTKIVTNQVAGAATYELKLAASINGLASPIFDKPDYASNQFDLTSAVRLGNGTWYGTVLARDSAGAALGTWCTPFSFKIQWSGYVYSPTFSPAAGAFSTDQSVSISCSTTGANIFYTTDGSAPTTSSTLYTGPISVAGDGTNVQIKAIGSCVGGGISSSSSAIYAIDCYVWTNKSQTADFVTVSADGSHIAATYNGGKITTSGDYGATWTANAAVGNKSWHSIASSPDGRYLAACGSSAALYTSNDFGATWISQTTGYSGNWNAVALSSDGSRLVLGDVASNGNLWISSDSGSTWTKVNGVGSGYWKSAASSADGKYLVACSSSTSGYVWTSSDYGVTWTQQTSPNSGSWYSACTSSDGHYVAVCSYNYSNGYIWTSSDYGSTWTKQATLPVTVIGIRCA